MGVLPLVEGLAQKIRGWAPSVKRSLHASDVQVTASSTGITLRASGIQKKGTAWECSHVFPLEDCFVGPVHQGVVRWRPCEYVRIFVSKCLKERGVM